MLRTCRAISIWPLLRGAIDLGDHGFEHRRAGRHFGDLDAGSEAPGHGDQLLANALGDVVALELALRLSDEVHLDIGDIGPAPQEVVAHQAVEVVGRGDAGVGLEIHDLGLLLDDGGQFAGDAGRLFERRSLGHVDDDLELALVVERQHLHLDEADADESHRAEEQHGDQRQKSVARRGVVEQRIHHATVEAGEAVLAFAVGVAGGAAEDPDGGPRRHHQGDDQREHHGRRGPDGDRPHVGTRQPADESDGQDRGNHGQSGEDRRVADFIDCFDGHLRQAAALVVRQARMAHDVLRR